ncbi:DUF6197 family protein [Asanoa iriomotensis]|uniref:Uncharacterized protein n=1 Tax=Asanoa iriomotensis TaxID=234613 RepID=A0ABQ4C5M5_9ACTN|nr:hypothetical protein [Asanoa iriomotensis]GIF58059.1 hypothetical protein Air01nite_41540 [Asanoa iriomotensis]
MQPTQNQAEQTSATPFRRWDRAPETPSDSRFFDLREAGYLGWIDQDGYAVQEFTEVDPDPATATPAIRLRTAACYLRRHGWHQGDMFADPDAPYPAACALGAIRMAVYGTSVIDADAPKGAEAFEATVCVLADYLVMHLDVPDPSDALAAGYGEDLEELVGGWNDDPARNVSHVIAAFYGAADEWDRIQRKRSVPVCCGAPMAEDNALSPSASCFPGDGVRVERVYRCGLCDKWKAVEVTDPDEADRLFGQALNGDVDPGGAR